MEQCRWHAMSRCSATSVENATALGDGLGDCVKELRRIEHLDLLAAPGFGSKEVDVVRHAPDLARRATRIRGARRGGFVEAGPVQRSSTKSSRRWRNEQAEAHLTSIFVSRGGRTRTCNPRFWRRAVFGLVMRCSCSAPQSAPHRLALCPIDGEVLVQCGDVLRLRDPRSLIRSALFLLRCTACYKLFTDATRDDHRGSAESAA